jgi:hypothetical protein
MTPRDFRVMVEGRTVQIRQHREFLDRLQAAQTARLINVQCGTEKDPNPAKTEMCMAYDWTIPKKTEDKTEDEMTEEEMETFDKNMDSWARATREKFHG